LADSLMLGLRPGDRVSLGGHNIELRFQPGLPTLVPVPACGSGRHGSSLRSYADVVVVERDGAHLHFDIDGDEVADGTVELGHDLRPFGDDARAVLGRLHQRADEWYFVSTDDVSPLGEPQIVEIVEISADGPIARPAGGDPAVTGPLLAPPNSPPVDVRPGDRVWAVNTDADPYWPTWITLSTPLPLRSPARRP
jgi:hypothetical protein